MAISGKGNAGVPRRKKGFSQAGSLVRKQISNVGEGRGFAESRLLTHWAEIVGPDIASLCQPLRVSYGKRGLGATLTLLARGAAGPQIQAQLPRLRDLVNACYGYNAIVQIKMTQTAPTGFGDAQSPFAVAPDAKPPRQASPQVTSAAQSATDEIDDPSLRAALAGLGENVFSRK